MGLLSGKISPLLRGFKKVVNNNSLPWTHSNLQLGVHKVGEKLRPKVFFSEGYLAI